MADDITPLAGILPGVEPGALVSHVEAPTAPNGEHEPPLPKVSVPDVALQVSPCLDVFSGILGVDVGPELENAFRDSFGPDVRRRCAARPGFGAPVETVAVWSEPATGAGANGARDRGLASVAALSPGRPFAFFFSRTYMRKLLVDAFEAMPTHRFDGDGNPDPDGPAHLTGVAMELQPPDTVKTILSGFDERPFPDVDFRITVRDQLATGGGHLTCSTTRDLETDTGLLNFLAILTAPLLIFLIERIVVAIKSDPPSSTAADCWVAALAREEIAIAGGRKVLLSYGDVQVTTTGLILNAPVGGLPTIIPRRPTVEIVGRAAITDRRGLGFVRATYSAATEDLRGRVRYSWAVDGIRQAEPSSSIRVTLFVPPGKAQTRRLTVTARDADGLTATEDLDIRVASILPPGGQEP